MKKIISYCLWGNLPLYTVGAISNAKQAKEIYPGWICRFYIHQPSVPAWVVEELQKQDSVEIVFYTDDVGWGGMLYRFYPATEDDVEVMLSRDTDSRLSIREKACVDDWLNNSSQKKVHTIRDACVHQSQMMGGLWGVRDGYLNWIKPHINKLLYALRNGEGRKGLDQDFLNRVVYLYAVGVIDKETLLEIDPSSKRRPRPNMLSHDDIAFGIRRFPNFTRLPHVNDEMRPLPIQRKYGKEYKACSSCGLDHDSEFIGRDECLTDEECKYINLTPEQIEERHNIVKYYKLYQKDRHILGLTTIYE